MTIQPTVDNTWGVALMGFVVAAMLYGITTVQVYIYFFNYPQDLRRFKALAVLVWCLDTCSLALVSNGMYGYLITDITQPMRRLKVNRSLDVDPLIMGSVGFLTHTYLGARVWRVCNKNIFLGASIALLTFIDLGLAIAASIESFRFDLWTEKSSMKPLALASTALCVVLDSLIAIILCVYLVKQEPKGKDLRKIVRRVVIFAINTGLASSMLSIFNVVTFLAMPDTMIFLASTFIFTKVYANILLANLNARDSLRGKGYSNDGTLSLNLSALRTSHESAIVYRDPPTTISEPGIDLTTFPNDSSKAQLRSESSLV
ncbi:hypothetical protein B0H34DRAFT_795467 [Crassisporium funariophilum]|nr:hypothetical protein B0H34DRAFT_795467 [Crassisporium funariophilum]